MASPSDFKASIKEGINGNGTAWSAPYLNNINGAYVSPIQELAKDLFSKGGISISQAIDDMENIDKEVEKTNFLYKKYEDKKTLMKQIIENMQKLKQMKASMDPSIIHQACNTYNSCLYGAKWGFVNDLEYNFVKTVNSKTKDEVYQLFKDRKENGKWVRDWKNEKYQVGFWSGESYRKERAATNGWKIYQLLQAGPFTAAYGAKCDGKPCGSGSAAAYQQSIRKMEQSLSRYGAKKSLPSVPSPGA